MKKLWRNALISFSIIAVGWLYIHFALGEFVCEGSGGGARYVIARNEQAGQPACPPGFGEVLRPAEVPMGALSLLALGIFFALEYQGMVGEIKKLTVFEIWRAISFEEKIKLGLQGATELDMNRTRYYENASADGAVFYCVRPRDTKTIVFSTYIKSDWPDYSRTILRGGITDEAIAPEDALRRFAPVTKEADAEKVYRTLSEEFNMEKSDIRAILEERRAKLETEKKEAKEL